MTLPSYTKYWHQRGRCGASTGWNVSIALVSEHEGVLVKHVEKRKNEHGAESVLVSQPAGVVAVTTVTDSALVRQMLLGDQKAFETLVQRYQTQIFHWIRRYLSDEEQAWDVFQQVLLKLFVSLPSLFVEEQLGPWLFSVTRNCCIDTLRRRRVLCFADLGWETEEGEQSPLTFLADPDPTPEEMVEQRELQHRLHAAIEGLPPRFRSIVLLRYTYQLSFPEIGQQLQMPANTAKTYFHRACSLLRTTLTVQGQIDFPVRSAHGH
jgi:RNA polymerase sigma-70 factor, ECF subfamily